MAASLVQSNSGAVSTATTGITPTLAAPAGAGNLLIVEAAAGSVVGAGNRPSGYTQSTGMGQVTNLAHYLWWKVATGGEDDAPFTLDASATCTWVMKEYSGLDSSPYDTSDGNTGAGTGTHTTPAITPTAGDRLLVASIGGINSVNVDTLGSWTNSFTEREDDATTLAAGASLNIGSADRSITANGTDTFSTTATYEGVNDPDANTGLIISFKVAGAGGNQTPTPGAGSVPIAGTTLTMGRGILMPDEL